MSSEQELDEGIKSIKSAWRREHTARTNLKRMLEQAEAENERLRKKNDDLARLANIDAMMIFLSRDCSFKDCKECDVNHLCDEAVYLQGLYGIDKDLAEIEVEA